MAHKIIITELDNQRLNKIIDDVVQHDSNEKKHIQMLKNELSHAKIVAPDEIPNNIITMNSKFLLSIGDTDEELYSLVYPEQADIANNNISIMAPIGTAILGYKEGDTIEWQVPDGKIKIKVIKILYQPESEKDFEL